MASIGGGMEYFVGREPELKAVRDILRKEKGVLLFTGESGMGKTTLLKMAVAEWEGKPDIVVALHECWGDSGPSPFVALLAELLKRLGEKQVRPLGEHLKAVGQGIIIGPIQG